MLVEQLQRMQALLEARKERRNEREQLRNLTDVEKQLSELEKRWNDLSEVAVFLGYERSTVENLLTFVGTMAERFEQGLPIPKNDIRELQLHIDTIENDLKERWTIKRDDFVADALLARARIALAISTSKVKVALKPIYDEVIRLLGLSLPSVRQLEELKSAASHLEHQVSQALPAMSSEVQVFLEKLSINQAKVSDLTPTIMQWCSDQHLSDQISLRFIGG